MLLTAEDLALFAGCFADNGGARSPASMRWLYRDNPSGRLYVDFAVPPEGAGLAAIYATLPVRMRVNGEVRLALQSLDTLTDRAFRGKGLFVSLAKSVFARAAADDVAFIYGFPNGSSAPGFFGKLGWERLDPVPFLIRPLRTRYFSSRLGRVGSKLPDFPLAPSRRRGPRGGAQLVEVDRFDERFTHLWRAFSRDVCVAVERDAAYLDWRLVDKPEERYRRLALVEKGVLTSFIAFALKEKHGGRIGYVLELLHDKGRESDARWLLGAAVAEMAQQNADAVLAWCLPRAPTFGSYLRSGFFPLPERLRPIELHVGTRAFDGTLGPVLRSRRNWYISYLDSDTV